MTVTLAPSSGVSTVSVAPTTTTVLSVDTRSLEMLTVQVTNLDGSQTFSGTVQMHFGGACWWTNP